MRSNRRSAHLPLSFLPLGNFDICTSLLVFARKLSLPSSQIGSQNITSSKELARLAAKTGGGPVSTTLLAADRWEESRMARPIRVLLVDDHAIFRQALRTDLEAYPNIEIVGEAEDGEAAVLSAVKLQPTAIVMDINMSRMDGIRATRLIKKENPDIAVVGLSLYPQDYQIYAMVKAGAFKVLDKDGAVTELYGTLQQAVAGIRPIVVLEEPSDEKSVDQDRGTELEIPHSTSVIEQTHC